VTIWQSLPADLRGKIVGVSASTRDDVELVLKSGSKVRWGSSEQGALKAQVLSALLQRRAGFYDVSAPELPTTQQEKAD
jgi:cell division protein FtsQ